MCEPDLGMVTYTWVKGFEQVFPDFNVYVTPVLTSLIVTDTCYGQNAQVSTVLKSTRLG